MDDSWVKSYRRITEKGWYKKSEYFHLWHHLIYKATHAGNEFYFNGENMKLKSGEFITGRKKLSEETGINESKIERILNFFEKSEQQIEQQKTNKNRLIRVLNYEKYQFKIPSEQQNKQQLNNRRTTTEQQLNTINKDNKDNNVKKVPPQIEDVKEYCLERKNGVDPERWFNFYSAKGWMIGKNKMKDWKAAVRTWEEKQKVKDHYDQPAN